MLHLQMSEIKCPQVTVNLFLHSFYFNLKWLIIFFSSPQESFLYNSNVTSVPEFLIQKTFFILCRDLKEHVVSWVFLWSSHTHPLLCWMGQHLLVSLVIYLLRLMVFHLEWLSSELLLFAAWLQIYIVCANTRGYDLKVFTLHFSFPLSLTTSYIHNKILLDLLNF